jgi:hypothetical protein
LVRLVYNFDDADQPVTEAYRFFGKIVSITPDPGMHGPRRTHVQVHDLMDDLTETALRNITLQLNQTEAQLMATLCAALPAAAQPLALKLDPGLDTCPYAFDTLGAGEKAIGPAGQLAISALGYVYMLPTGVLRYENRQARQLKNSSATFADNMTGLAVPADLGGVFNHIRATIHPKTVDATATTVLWSQTGTAPSIAAGTTITLWGNYFNPTNPSMSIGGTAQLAPVATTDYTGNTAADGTGTDKTAKLTIVATPFVSTVKFDITNTDTGTVFLTKLQIRGKGLYDLSPVTVESASVKPYDRTFDIDLPYQGDYNKAQGLADYLRFQYEALGHQIDELVFDAQRWTDFLVFALTCQIGDRLTVSETQTGLALADAFIQSIELSATPTGGGGGECFITCRLGIASTSFFSNVWVMDDATRSLADISTNFGFA